MLCSAPLRTSFKFNESHFFWIVPTDVNPIHISTNLQIFRLTPPFRCPRLELPVAIILPVTLKLQKVLNHFDFFSLKIFMDETVPCRIRNLVTEFIKRLGKSMEPRSHEHRLCFLLSNLQNIIFIKLHWAKVKTENHRFRDILWDVNFVSHLPSCLPIYTQVLRHRRQFQY